MHMLPVRKFDSREFRIFVTDASKHAICGLAGGRGAKVDREVCGKSGE